MRLIARAVSQYARTSASSSEFHARLTTEAALARTGRGDDRRPAGLARSQEATRPARGPGPARERDGLRRSPRGCPLGRPAAGDGPEDGAAVCLATASAAGGGFGTDPDAGPW